VRLERQLSSFLDFLRVERGLSQNTLAAYGRDLKGFVSFFTETTDGRPGSLDLGVVSGWLQSLTAAGLSPRSAGRHLSALRGFTKFLINEGVLERDPTEHAARARTGRRLPRPLGVDEVIELIDAPDPATRRGLRDRAMLSLMYASGLRVSELVNLKLGDIDRARGVVAAYGKGGKRRLVPLGEVALAHLDEYLASEASARKRPIGGLLFRTRAARPGLGRRCGSSSRGTRVRVGSRPTFTRIACATRSRPTCCRVGQIYAVSRRCSAMRIS
jgi:integrase/recombinase XerD